MVELPGVCWADFPAGVAAPGVCPLSIWGRRHGPGTVPGVCGRRSWAGLPKRINYGAARRGGYHIGSGAIESANKFIAHARLKRSGAWWYPTHADNILKLRCAKHNGIYDHVIELFQN